MSKYISRTTLRINENLKTLIDILAAKNNMSFNKMATTLLILGCEELEKSYKENINFQKGDDTNNEQD